MIKFLNLKGQLTEGVPSFAFWDINKEQIIILWGQEIFDSLEEFNKAYEQDTLLGLTDDGFTREEYLDSIPKDFF